MDVPARGATDSPPTDGMAGDSVAVAAWTLVSRVTGFVRVAATAAVLGPTFFGNLFEATNLLPNLAFELLTGPLIAALLVPPLVRVFEGKGAVAAERLAGGFLSVITLVFTAAIAVVIAGGPIVLGLLTILVPDAAVRADQLDVGWPLLAMLMPQALFYAIGATGAAVQNARGKFALAAAAPTFENLTIIGVVAASGWIFGSGIEVDEITLPHLLLLGLGTTSGVMIHAAVQWWGARRVGIRLLPRGGWRDPEVRQILRLSVPSTGFASMVAVRTLGTLVVAGSIPGGVVAFQLGRYFFNFPVAIGARPVIAAQLPRLARSHADGQRAQFQDTYRRGIDLILFVVVPATLLLTFLAGPMANAAAYGEMATARGLAMATVAIATLAPGILGESLFLTATSAFYAVSNAKLPAIAMFLRLALTAVGVGVVLVLDLSPMPLLAGLGVSLAFSDLITGFGLHRALERRVGFEQQPPARLVATLIVAALSVALGALAHAVFPGSNGLVAAGTAAATTVVAYLAIQRWRRAPELTELLTVFSGAAHG